MTILSSLFIKLIAIIIMENCKVPTLQLQVLNKHNINTMYIEMETANTRWLNE